MIPAGVPTNVAVWRIANLALPTVSLSFLFADKQTDRTAVSQGHDDISNEGDITLQCLHPLRPPVQIRSLGRANAPNLATVFIER